MAERLTKAQVRKLDRIRRRDTLYEVELVHRQTGERCLLCYCHRTGSRLAGYIARHAEALVAFCGSDTYATRRLDLREEFAIGEWGMRWTGRTQREAIMHGELVWFRTPKGGA